MFLAAAEELRIKGLSQVGRVLDRIRGDRYSETSLDSNPGSGSNIQNKSLRSHVGTSYYRYCC